MTHARREAPDDIPQLIRLNVEVADLDAAISFYTDLFRVRGRKQPGTDATCGPVTLQVLDVSSNGQPHPAAKALSFTVENLEAAFDRAKALSCLSRKVSARVHRQVASSCARGASDRFYAEDPWGKPLCFVEEGTVYTG